MKHSLLALIVFYLLLGCSQAPEKNTMTINDIAKDYVKLVLQVGQYDSDVVDAYYGPQEWKPESIAADAAFPHQDFYMQAQTLMSALDNVDLTRLEAEQSPRANMLKKQLIAIATKIEMMGGKTYSFDEEAKRLYDAQPPVFDLAYFDELLTQLDNHLPGEGDISARYNEYANQFIIPSDKLNAVFKVAIADARKITLAHMNLADNENFALEFVTDKAWSGYNFYQGNSQSLIQLNTDLPIFIDRVVDLAAHEGYPGHHVFNALLEQNLVNNKGWMEFSVYQLFSPQSLIAEGSANYGIEVVFPGDARIKYEKEVLFPLAGIDPSEADQYYLIQALRAKLNYAGNETARKYLNGDIQREEAAAMLEKYLLYSPERALQRTRFMDKYRSYVINYNLGKDLVADYVEAKGGTAQHPEKRWEVFKDLLSSPNTASSIAL